MKKITVLHLINSYTLAGAEILITNLAAKMDKTKFNVIVCSMASFRNDIEKNMRQKLEENQVKALTLAKKPGVKSVSSILKLRKLLIEENVDIIHTHCPSPDAYGRVAAILANVPVIINTLHSTSYSNYLVNRFLSYPANLHIAVSEAVKKWSVANLKLQNKKIKVIHNAINIEEFAKSRVNKSRKKKELGIDIEKTVITTVGRLTKQKGQIYLIKAADQILKAGIDAEFLIIGEGELRQNLENLTKDLHLEDRIHFLGVREDVNELLGISDIFVLPSLCEGFGIVIIEAMAAGVPVIASNIDGIKEVIEDKKTGLLVPSKSPKEIANGVIYLLESTKKVQSMTKRASEKVKKKFSIDRMVKEYENVYEGYFQ